MKGAAVALVALFAASGLVGLAPEVSASLGSVYLPSEGVTFVMSIGADQGAVVWPALSPTVATIEFRTAQRTDQYCDSTVTWSAPTIVATPGDEFYKGTTLGHGAFPGPESHACLQVTLKNAVGQVLDRAQGSQVYFAPNPSVGTMTATQSGPNSVTFQKPAGWAEAAGLYVVATGGASSQHGLSGSTTVTVAGASLGDQICGVARKSSGGFAVSNLACITVAEGGAPSAPANLQASAGTQQVSLSWSAGLGGGSVSNYEVFRGGQSIATPTGTSYVDTGRTGDTQYCYTVRAQGPGGNSGHSTQACATPTFPAPGQPALQATPGSAQVMLSWNDVGQGESYRLQRLVTGTTYSDVTTTTGFSHTDTGRVNGQQYCYRVRAENSGGNGAYSAQACATPQVQAPSSVSGFTANQDVAGARQTSVTLTWSSLSGATGYRIERSVDGAAYGLLGTYGQVATSAQDSNAPFWKQYCYRIQASNAGGSGPWTTQCVEVHDGTPGVVAAPILTPDAGEIHVDWNAGPTPGTPTHYNLYRRVGQGGAWTSISMAAATTTDYLDTGRTNGQEYCYRVDAYNNGPGVSTGAISCAEAGAVVDLQWSATTYDCAGQSAGTTFGQWAANPGASNVDSLTWLRVTNGGSAEGNLQVAFSANQFTGGGYNIPIDGNIRFLYGTGDTPPCGTATETGIDADGIYQFTVPAEANHFWIGYRIVTLPGVLADATYTSAYTTLEIP